jgi:hypothetical protein
VEADAEKYVYAKKVLAYVDANMKEWELDRDAACVLEFDFQNIWSHKEIVSILDESSSTTNRAFVILNHTLPTLITHLIRDNKLDASLSVVAVGLI